MSYDGIVRPTCFFAARLCIISTLYIDWRKKIRRLVLRAKMRDNFLCIGQN